MVTKPMLGGILAAVSAAAVLAFVPLSGNAAVSSLSLAQESPSASPSPSSTRDCQKLRDDLSSALTEIASLLQAGLPDPAKVLALVRKAMDAMRALLTSGCLIDPVGVSPPPSGGKAIPAKIDPCAAPAAELVSRLYALLSATLDAHRAASPEAVPMLREATKAQDAVAELSTSRGGERACLR